MSDAYACSKHIRSIMGPPDIINLITDQVSKCTCEREECLGLKKTACVRTHPVFTRGLFLHLTYGLTGSYTHRPSQDLIYLREMKKY